MKTLRMTTFGLLCVCSLAHAAAPAKAEPQAVRAALTRYLAQQGQLCLGKFVWPVEVSAADQAAGTRDALQMPVLERLGLVTASPATVQRRDEADAEVSVALTRYALSEAGQKYYLQRTMLHTTPAGKEVIRQGDFCVATLSLDRVLRWDVPAAAGAQLETTASYTYKITAAGWTGDPALRAVFPMMAKVIDGAGKMELKQKLRLDGKRWATVNAWD